MRWPIWSAPLLLCLAGASCYSKTPGNGTIEVERGGPTEADAMAEPLASGAGHLTLPPISVSPRSTTSTSSTAATVAPAATSLLTNGPASLSLASAGIELGSVVAATVDDRGSLQVAGSAIGWYPHEAGLGRPGTALLAAHVAYNGENGPFRRLDHVEIGDALDVVLEDGTTYTYVVESIEVHVKEEIPIDELTTMSGTDRVALVTCTGGFDRNRRSYDSNLVVIASRIHG